MRLRHAVLHVDLIDVDVGVDVESDCQLLGAVIGIGRLHIEHVVHAVHLLFERRGDRLLNRDGIRACVVCRDDDLRRHDSGNCASGNPNIAMRPPITVTIAITIATIGRLMKKLEIIVNSSPIALVSVRRGKRLRIDDRFRSDFLCAFGDDVSPGFRPFSNDPHRVRCVRHLDGRIHLVVIANDGDLITALQLGDGTLRNEQRASLHAGDRADATVLAGPQDFPGFGKTPAKRIAPVFDLPADPRQRTGPFRIGRAVGQDQFELELSRA